MEKLYSSSVITAAPKDSVFEVLKKMQSHLVKRVVISTNKIPLGIITERDINKFLEKDKTSKAIDEISIDHVMENNIVLITDNLEDDFYQCASKMNNLNIGSLVIVDREGKISGIVTRTDLVKAYANIFGTKYSVKDFMSTKMITCRKSDSLKFALSIMNQNNVSRLIVTDEKGMAIGLISTNTLLTHSDYFTKGSTRSRDYLLPLKKNLTVNDLIEENLITIKEDEDLAKAASLMIKRKISGIPVLDSEENLVGLISKSDIVKAFSDVVPHEHLKLKYKEMY